MKPLAEEKKDSDEALRSLARAPRDALAWDAVGRVLSRAGRHGEAHAAFAELSRLAPGDFAIAMRCARAAAAAGKALAELGRHRDRDNPVALASRAHLLASLGRHDEAMAEAERAVALAPDAAEPAVELASIAFAARHGSADRVLAHALVLDPANAGLRHKLGALLVRLRRPIAAERELGDALRLDPDNPRIAADRASALAQMGDQQAACDSARRAVELAPSDAAMHRQLCNCLAYAERVGGERLSMALRRGGALWPRGEPVADDDERRFGSAAAIPPSAIPPSAIVHARSPEKVLRVGLLPAAVWQHPVMGLTIGGLEALDLYGVRTPLLRAAWRPAALHPGSLHKASARDRSLVASGVAAG